MQRDRYTGEGSSLKTINSNSGMTIQIHGIVFVDAGSCKESHNPASGNVVFVVGDDNTKQLYAYQIILMENSELFSEEN